MITLHHLNNSRSQRVLWMLEELGLPYQIERYQRDAKTISCKRWSKKPTSSLSAHSSSYIWRF